MVRCNRNMKLLSTSKLSINLLILLCETVIQFCYLYLLRCWNLFGYSDQYLYGILCWQRVLPKGERRQLGHSACDLITNIPTLKTQYSIRTQTMKTMLDKMCELLTMQITSRSVTLCLLIRSSVLNLINEYK
jgi:hypothetical protein